MKFIGGLFKLLFRILFWLLKHFYVFAFILVVGGGFIFQDELRDFLRDSRSDSDHAAGVVVAPDVSGYIDSVIPEATPESSADRMSGTIQRAEETPETATPLPTQSETTSVEPSDEVSVSDSTDAIHSEVMPRLPVDPVETTPVPAQPIELFGTQLMPNSLDSISESTQPALAQTEPGPLDVVPESVLGALPEMGLVDDIDVPVAKLQPDKIYPVPAQSADSFSAQAMPASSEQIVESTQPALAQTEPGPLDVVPESVPGALPEMGLVDDIDVPVAKPQPDKISPIPAQSADSFNAQAMPDSSGSIVESTEAELAQTEFRPLEAVSESVLETLSETGQVDDLDVPAGIPRPDETAPVEIVPPAAAPLAEQAILVPETDVSTAIKETQSAVPEVTEMVPPVTVAPPTMVLQPEQQAPNVEQARPESVAPLPAPSLAPESVPLGQLWYDARRAYWQKNYELAEEKYRAAAAYPNAGPDVYGELGNLFYQQGRVEEAGEAYYDCARALLDRGQVDEATRMLQLLSSLSPQRAEELRALLDTATN